MNPRFTISLLTYTALPQAKACIASVLKSTVPFELILTANGNPEAGEYFEELKAEYGNIRVIHNSRNEGFIEPNRLAFGLMETPFGIFLNDDVTVPPDWLERLVEPFDRDIDMAIVGVNSGCSSLRDDGIGFRGKTREYVEFSTAMVRASLIKQIGLFSSYLDFCYFEDSDTSLRAREAGYHIKHVDVAVTHKGGATSQYMGAELFLKFHKNKAAFCERWADYLKSKDRKFPHEK